MKETKSIEELESDLKKLDAKSNELRKRINNEKAIRAKKAEIIALEKDLKDLKEGKPSDNEIKKYLDELRCHGGCHHCNHSRCWQCGSWCFGYHQCPPYTIWCGGTTTGTITTTGTYNPGNITYTSTSGNLDVSSVYGTSNNVSTGTLLSITGNSAS